jgi:hypothetical protein
LSNRGSPETAGYQRQAERLELNSDVTIGPALRAGDCKSIQI